MRTRLGWTALWDWLLSGINMLIPLGYMRDVSGGSAGVSWSHLFIKAQGGGINQESQDSQSRYWLVTIREYGVAVCLMTSLERCCAEPFV